MEKNNEWVLNHIKEMVHGPEDSEMAMLLFVNGNHRRVYRRMNIV